MMMMVIIKFKKQMRIIIEPYTKHQQGRRINTRRKLTIEIEITIILITIAFINKWRQAGAYKKMRSYIKMATKGKKRLQLPQHLQETETWTKTHSDELWRQTARVQADRQTWLTHKRSLDTPTQMDQS